MDMFCDMVTPTTFRSGALGRVLRGPGAGFPLSPTLLGRYLRYYSPSPHCDYFNRTVKEE